MKRNLWCWALYDFANSVIMIVFLFYFSQWLVVDRGEPDWWYNASLVFSSILLIVVAPALGRRLDQTGRKLAGVRWTTLIMALLYLATALVMLFWPAHTILATVLFTLAMFVYLLSFVYYTPMINDLSHAGNRGRISGLGMWANYLGQVLGLLVTLPFATGAIYLVGAPGRPQTLLPAMALFVLTALPLLLWYREPPLSAATATVAAPSSQPPRRATWRMVKQVFGIKNLGWLLVAYFLFSDAMLTFSNNYPIFLEKVFQATDSTKAYLTAGILTLAGIGAFLFGKLSDRRGTKGTLLLVLTSWIILFPLIAFAPNFTWEVIVCLIAGVMFGPVWSVSRAMVSEYTPRAIEASAFSIYLIAERFATFIGPLTWSLILWLGTSRAPANYSYAVVGMGALVLISLFFVAKIKPSDINQTNNGPVV